MLGGCSFLYTKYIIMQWCIQVLNKNLRKYRRYSIIKVMYNIIDIHCHLLCGVDDGAKTIEESEAMLQEAHRQGITGIILTPHYRHGMFSYPKELIEENFALLQPYAMELGITLALGTEYHVNSHMVEALEGGRCLTLAGTRYVLAEFSHDAEYSYIYQMAQELIFHGFVPIIAHIERCAAITADMENADRLKSLGAWIQINADAVLGMEGTAARRFCKKMLKAGYVDVIASDSHGMVKRACHMDRCYALLEKKYGREYADELMYDMPYKVLNGVMQ